MIENSRSIQLVHATASTPGAIAILQLIGEGCDTLLRELTGAADWPIGRMRLVDFAGIDEGLAVRLNERVAQIMPHGGPRVVQRLTAKLIALGVTITSADDGAVDPQLLYPEAEDRIEAMMLATLARAASPLAIDALLAQPERWRDLKQRRESPSESDLAASRILNRLIAPPIVVLAGQPNVGKSTLSNALLGRAMSIASPTAGTTRDYVAGRIDLAGLVVDWHDTPGLRADADVIESRAIEIAGRLIEQADLVIAMRDAEHDWPTLPRVADVFVMNKVDDVGDDHSSSAGVTAGNPLRISAKTGGGLATLTTTIRDRLVSPELLQRNGCWVFDRRLAE